MVVLGGLILDSEVIGIEDRGGVCGELVRARWLTDQECPMLLRIARWGRRESVRVVLDPRWAGGRPCPISDADVEFVVAVATTRPAELGCRFTHWSIRTLADHLDDNPIRQRKIGRERLRQILRECRISLQCIHTWKKF